MQETKKPEYAGFFVRFAAFIMDAAIVGILLFIMKAPMWFASLGVEENILMKPVFFQFSVWNILFYIVGSLYYVIMIYMSGATIGKKLMKLKVVTAEGERLSFITSLYRETVGKYLSSIVLGVGYFLIGVDFEKRGLHDILCDTRVVYNFDDEKKSQNLEDTYMKTTENINETFE